MKRVLAATCFAAACSVALAAQPPAKPDPSKGKGQPSAAEEKTTTVTGCLRAGDQPGTFVLANVKSDVKGEKGMMTLRLIGAPANLDLKAHVGHTVRLTGMMVPQGEGRGKEESAAGTAGTIPPTMPPTTPPQPETPPAPPTAPPVPPTGSTPTTAPPTPTTPPQPTTPPEPTTGQSTAGQSKSGAAMQSFNVKTMTHVSDKCPM